MGQREEEKEEDTGKEKNRGRVRNTRHVCGMPLYPDASQSWVAFQGPVEG